MHRRSRLEERGKSTVKGVPQPFGDLTPGYFKRQSDPGSLNDWDPNFMKQKTQKNRPALPQAV